MQVPAQSSAVYFTLDEKELLANADPKKSFLVFELAVGGQNVSRNLIFFDTMHNLELPESVHVDASLESANGGYIVTLRSPALARSVYLSFGDLDVQPSDNYFDLLPGEAVTIRVRAASTEEQMKAALKVVSLTEAFDAK